MPDQVHDERGRAEAAADDDNARFQSDAPPSITTHTASAANALAQAAPMPLLAPATMATLSCRAWLIATRSTG
jgi:hypothetical protein